MHPLDFVSGFRGPAALFPSVFSQGLAVGFWTCDWEGPSVRGKTSRAPAQVQLISSEVETVSVWPQFLPRVQFLLLLPASGSCNADGAVRWKQSARLTISPTSHISSAFRNLSLFPEQWTEKKNFKKNSVPNADTAHGANAARKAERGRAPSASPRPHRARVLGRNQSTLSSPGPARVI